MAFGLGMYDDGGVDPMIGVAIRRVVVEVAELKLLDHSCL